VTRSLVALPTLQGRTLQGGFRAPPACRRRVRGRPGAGQPERADREPPARREGPSHIFSLPGRKTSVAGASRGRDHINACEFLFPSSPRLRTIHSKSSIFSEFFPPRNIFAQTSPARPARARAEAVVSNRCCVSTRRSMDDAQREDLISESLAAGQTFIGFGRPGVARARSLHPRPVAVVAESVSGGRTGGRGEASRSSPGSAPAACSSGRRGVAVPDGPSQATRRTLA
jgi:hypothetical protein